MLNFKKLEHMKKVSLVILLVAIFILNSCAPKVSTTISKSYPALDYREDVKVFGIQDSEPANAEELGIVKIGDAGFTKDCGLDLVLEKAKAEARKVGGNAIKIIDHNPPGLGSSCHRITAKILKVEHLDSSPIDSSLINADYALLHVYRFSGPGALVNYDLYLGDSIICRVSNNFKKTIKIRKDGLNTIWAKTEAKVEIPINIKFGKEYYIRCGITVGIMIGRPKIDLVDNQIGRMEYQSIKQKKSDKRDIIVLNDGREIECIIEREDTNNVYIIMFKNGKEIKTNISKDQIKSISKSE